MVDTALFNDLNVGLVALYIQQIVGNRVFLCENSHLI